MERREYERFEKNAFSQTLIFSIDNLEDADFIDYSQQGLSFSSAATLSIGDRFNINIRATNDTAIVSALVCNRCKMPDGQYRYGLFLNSKLSEFINN